MVGTLGFVPLDGTKGRENDAHFVVHPEDVAGSSNRSKPSRRKQDPFVAENRGKRDWKQEEDGMKPATGTAVGEDWNDLGIREQTRKQYEEDRKWKEKQARVRNMTIKDLRVALRERGCSPAGPREELVERLLCAIKEELPVVPVHLTQSSCQQSCKSVVGHGAPGPGVKSDVADVGSDKENRTKGPHHRQINDNVGDMFAEAGTRSGHHAVGGIRQAPGGNSSITLG